MSIRRHFTATGFVVHQDRILLHWHPKVQAWLPPGGHVEDNEDPVQAVLREIQEETGVKADVVFTGHSFDLDYPEMVPPPLTILIEDIHDPVDGFHQHIDMIYVCLLSGPHEPLSKGWFWITREDLANSLPLDRDGAPSVPPPKDVRVLAEHAFQIIS